MNEKHKLIIDKSVELFAEIGYHATSVQEIDEKCGIAKGSFYNYFKSKEELLVSIFKGYVGILIRSKHAYNVNLMPIFLLNRIDSIIEGLLKTDDPLLNQLPWFECLAQAIEPKEEIKLLIDRLLRMKATGQVISKESEAIEAIREEFAKDRPSGIIIERLLLYLEKNEERSTLCSKLIILMKDYFHIHS